MATCPNCGEQVLDSYKFCRSCGVLLPVPAPVPQEELSEQDALSWQQPLCPEENPPENTAGFMQEPAFVQQDSASDPDSAAAQPLVYAVAVEQPIKPRKKTWLIIGVICGVALAAAAIVIGLILLFGSGIKLTPDDPNLGTYVGSTAEMWGAQMDIADLLGGNFVVELKEDGKCTVTAGKSSGPGTWTLEGDVITISDSTTTLVGTLKDGVMVFENVMDMEFSMVLYKIEKNDTAEISVSAADTEWWNGDWYGWWAVSSCDGVYEDWENAWWDCCATVAVDEDGQGHLLLWDEDMPMDNPLADIELTVFEKDGSGEMGVAVTGDGYFMDMKISDGAFTIDPSQYSYENLLVLEGWYETFLGSFYFEVCLRPWGQLWDDMIADDEGLAPYYYDQYLQAIERGESAPEDITAAWAN